MRKIRKKSNGKFGNGLEQVMDELKLAQINLIQAQAQLVAQLAGQNQRWEEHLNRSEKRWEEHLYRSEKLHQELRAQSDTLSKWIVDIDQKLQRLEEGQKTLIGFQKPTK